MSFSRSFVFRRGFYPSSGVSPFARGFTFHQGFHLSPGVSLFARGFRLSSLTGFKLRLPPFTKTVSHNNYTTNESTKNVDSKPILKELLYGRTRIYTALPPGSSHSPTSSKSSPTASSSPLYWQWQTTTSSTGVPEEKSKVFSFIGSIKQSLSAMFLPVGYPETVHECYAKFHIWLALETFIGSSTGVLCSQAMLSSLGLGHAEAAAGAVAIQ